MNNYSMRQYLTVLNVLDVLGISVLLLMAFGLQFYLEELPCPLCLLQRLGFLAIGFGFLLNLRYYPRPMHYAISLLAAVFTGLVALRQITLHILPGSGSYGSAILGWHYYTWAFALSLLAIIYTSIMLSFPEQYARRLQPEHVVEPRKRWLRRMCHFAFFLFFALAIANVVSIFLECGFHECPDNPAGYLFHIF